MITLLAGTSMTGQASTTYLNVNLTSSLGTFYGTDTVNDLNQYWLWNIGVTVPPTSQPAYGYYELPLIFRVGGQTIWSGGLYVWGASNGPFTAWAGGVWRIDESVAVFGHGQDVGTFFLQVEQVGAVPIMSWETTIGEYSQAELNSFYGCSPSTENWNCASPGVPGVTPWSMAYYPDPFPVGPPTGYYEFDLGEGPEPGTLLLTLSGIGLIAYYRRRAA
ncbi:MAG TPA: PEP-CTERM sorting domain-containing protein [Bryobacteraceae bacterium]|nr:PEP-CTERM sorting domain-containing protein [Bryobacteraceae bacterium]